MRMIDAEKLVKDIAVWTEENFYTPDENLDPDRVDYYNLVNAIAEAFIRFIMKQPTINTDRLKAFNIDVGKIARENWIPCREKLPDEDCICLVTLRTPYRKEDIVSAEEFNQGQWVSLLGREEVLAWMPSPEPYNEPERL